MKYFFVILVVLLSAIQAVYSQDTFAKQNKLEVDEIVKNCGPIITDKYVPDLILIQQYKQGTECIENNIKEKAKNIFDNNTYNNFNKYLSQTTFSYLQTIRLLNEQSKKIDGFSGTLEQLQTYSQFYDFLLQILTTVIDYEN